MGLQFDVALHAGTVLALILHFRSDWCALALAILGRGAGSAAEQAVRRRLGWYLLAACVPAGIAGLLFEQALQALESPLLVAGTLAGVGALILVADRVSRGTRRLQEAGLPDALFVGLAQALALIPGVSRSGITISAGLFRHLSREEAARFSFLLSVPITLGAALFELRHLAGGTVAAAQLPALIAGVIAAAVVGYATIAFLLDYLRRHDLRIFVYYRWALAALIVAVVFARGPAAPRADTAPQPTAPAQTEPWSPDAARAGRVAPAS